MLIWQASLDAEGSLLPTLIYETAELYAAHHGCKKISQWLPHPHADADTHAVDDANAVVDACSGIHYRRVYEASLLIAFLYALPSWLAEHKGVSISVCVRNKRSL